jgi:hypothetical protein
MPSPLSKTRRSIILIAAFILAIALTFVFGYRAGRQARMIRRENEPIHSWMSVPFIAHAHHVPAEVLYRAIGVKPQPKDRRPLRRLAREQERPVDQLIKELYTALNQNGHPVEPPSGRHKTP